MLTVVDSVNPVSWDEVIVDCDCGKRLTIPYMSAYRRQFSCGCRSRLRMNATDATGQRYFNAAGNAFKSFNDDRETRQGRALQILCRDPETQRWIYVCECCGETFTMPGGQERSAESMLRKLAGETCPNFRPLYHAQRDGKWHMDLDAAVLRSRLRIGSDPEDLAKYYTNPKHVVRDKFGDITGFLGMPDAPAFKKALKQYEGRIVSYRREERTQRKVNLAKSLAAFDPPSKKYEETEDMEEDTKEESPMPEIIEDDFSAADYEGYVPPVKLIPPADQM